MKDVKLTLYDWLGYLIPGTILIITVYFVFRDSSFFENLNFTMKSSFINGFIFLCIAYLTGHIVHSIANFTIDLLPYGDYAPKEYFETDLLLDFNPEQLETIKEILKSKYDIQFENKITKEELRLNYWFCYTNVTEKNSDSLSQTFLFLNGFYRGASVSMFLASLILFLKSILVASDSIFWILGSIFIFSSFLLYLRAKRFKKYLTRTVYLDFISLNNLKNDRT